MKRVISRIGMLAGALVVVVMLWLYAATETGVFESEPVGVIELRGLRDQGEQIWLPHQVAWLKLDDTHIDYPVMQANDNNWYLTHDYYDNKSISGAIFLDFRNASDFSDSLTIVYGHRMNGDLMFSDVARYRDEEYLNAHKTGTLYTPAKKYGLRVVEYNVVSAEADFYRTLSFGDYVTSRLLLLSTCNRGSHDKRDVLLLSLE